MPWVGSTVFGSREAREAASSFSRAWASASVMPARTLASSMLPLTSTSLALCPSP